MTSPGVRGRRRMVPIVTIARGRAVVGWSAYHEGTLINVLGAMVRVAA